MSTSSTVLADAQFGTARILRPFSGFRAAYQGQAATKPIMLTEVVDPPGGEPLDQLAAVNTPGYAPNLIRGVDVPLGSRVVIWLPKVGPFSADPAARYDWIIGWRLRNVYDYRQTRAPYHYPKQEAGVPVGGNPRVVIPAAVQTIVYSQTPAPAAAGAIAASSAYPETLGTGGSALGGTVSGIPLVATATDGTFEQGLSPSAAGQQPTYMIHEVQAVGDEMLIGVSRSTSFGANWNFTAFGSEDYILGSFLGDDYPDIGVYVLTGSAP